MLDGIQSTWTYSSVVVTLFSNVVVAQCLPFDSYWTKLVYDLDENVVLRIYLYQCIFPGTSS